MTQRIWKAYLLILGLFVGHATWASHIVGGNIRLLATGQPNRYHLALDLIIDEESSLQDEIKPGVRLAIYRRRDNLPMLVNVDLARQAITPVPAANGACSQLRVRRLALVRYGADVTLDADRYADPGGYYAVYGICCRNPAISNIDDPANAGMVFHLAFPSLKSTPNSSPVFAPVVSQYACLNQPSQFSFAATDADGDQLSYALVTPFKGFTDQGMAHSNEASSSYPTVQWRGGLSGTQPVPGTITIDDKTGRVSVTPSQVGLFVFSVECREFRNNVLIGTVRRDFQLVVVDCPTGPPPVPVIRAEQVPSTADQMIDGQNRLMGVTVCEGQGLVLGAEPGTNWSYQWRRDGQTLPGDTLPRLTITRSGEYEVIRSWRNSCAPPSTSPLRVRVKILPLPELPAENHSIKRGESITLNADGSDTLSYQWTPPESLSDPSSPRPVANPDQTVTYQLTASTAQGCSRSGEITVSVQARLFIPDAFTPNDDGVNDSWEIRGLDAYPGSAVEVYDRWGMLVYRSAAEGAFWDGRSRGERVPPGQYSYVIRLGSVAPLRGSLLILR